MDLNSFNSHLADRNQMLMRLVKNIGEAISPYLNELPDEYNEDLSNTIFKAAQEISEDLYTMLAEAREFEEEDEEDEY